MAASSDGPTDVGGAAAAASPENAVSVEKIMTLSLSEFSYSIQQFAGEEAAHEARQGRPVMLAAGEGEVAISFAPIEGFSFGGLVEMPRARVILTFTGCPEADRAAFLRRFDIAFQRGGG